MDKSHPVLEATKHKVPIYYILGENDWKPPYVIAEEYFKKINAPHKKIPLNCE